VVLDELGYPRPRAQGRRHLGLRRQR
jgi:hypothetical protein